MNEIPFDIYPQHLKPHYEENEYLEDYEEFEDDETIIHEAFSI